MSFYYFYRAKVLLNSAINGINKHNKFLVFHIQRFFRKSYSTGIPFI